MSFEKRNSVLRRAGIALDAQASNPIAAGETGFWYDGTTLYLVDSSGNLTPASAASRSWHEACRLATAAVLGTGTYSTTALTFTQTTHAAEQIDGVSVAVGDRVLVKNQADQTQNGIYVVTVVGTSSVKQVLTRAPDCNASNMFEPAFIVAIAEGSVNADSIFEFSTNAPFVMDTNNAVFASAPLAITYGLVGAMAAAGVAAANSAGVASSVSRTDHVHAPDTTLIATTTNTLEMTGKTLTAMVVKTGLTASGSATNDFSGSTGAFKTSTGVNTQGGLSAAGATTRQVADPGAGGAISVATDGVCNLTTAGAETRSLAIPTFIGQQLLISMDTKVGNATLTIAGTLMDGTNNTVIFSAVGQSIKLEGRTVGGTRCWALIANNGTALSHV